MTFSTYDELNQKMIEHFQGGEFQQALELIEKEGGNFPKDRPLVDYWTMCAAARLNNRVRLIEVAEKFHKDGLWFGEMMWRMTPSFKPLQGDVEFEQIVTESLNIQRLDQVAQKRVELRFIPDNVSSSTPLLIALHGNQNSAHGTLPFWRPAIDEGYALVIPQSTQGMFKGAFMWDDLDTSFAQVKACLETLKTEMAFDRGRIILGGHSMGGLIAIQMALTGELPVRGFIANGPALPFEDAPEALENALASAKDRGLRAYFIMGDHDVDIEQDAIRAFVEKMKTAGIPSELEVVPGATHDYNPNYDGAIVRALKFINS